MKGIISCEVRKTFDVPFFKDVISHHINSVKEGWEA